ncbi:aspartate--tRNA ligase MSD1 [Apiospora phragmitis]|uniref:Aspartate--tRNA ligase MSD1 n=1 Tax=Apiospora phragmitis TaxID=2905665 RepID=A0ABR1SXN8_9PEZI
MVRFSLLKTRSGAQRCTQYFSLGPGRRPWQLSSYRIRSIRWAHDDASDPAAKVETSISGTSMSHNSRVSAFKDFFAFDRPTRLPQYIEMARELKEVTVSGFLGKRRDTSSALSFCELDTFHKPEVQIVSQVTDGDDEAGNSAARAAHAALRAIPNYSPVVATGILVQRPRRVKALKEFGDSRDLEPTPPQDRLWDLKLTSIKPLNEFPKDIIVSKDTVWPPKQRHMQMRFDRMFRDRIRFRDYITHNARVFLRNDRFEEVETPMLFKSTPEGAREFLVPTRRAGYAYALPQSPQQYKQLLMAGGFRRYFQFARCFRDEDLRADRQPEFTQLDLEMSFASGRDVMREVERLIKILFKRISGMFGWKKINGIRHPVKANPELIKEARLAMARGPATLAPDALRPGRRLLMNFRDKPDLRMDSQIWRIDNLVSPDFVNMITKLEQPVVEAAQFRLTGTVQENQAFIHNFMDNLPKTPLRLSGDATPGVFVFDESKPLNGLAAFGHEAAEKLAARETTAHWKKLANGDIIIVQARKNVPFRGESWTDLGKLQKAIYEAALAQNLLVEKDNWGFCWITKFPLFTPNEPETIAAGEGQGGAAGFSSTHHPFTAPYGPRDFDLLATDPLAAMADHYDLVCRGVEVGGGSRRIHVAEMQEYVMHDVLQMTDAGMNQFSHLLEALRAGCPPHAGFAFGWDRFMSLLSGVDSVRDVIAFPKSMKGEDLFVNSPTKMTDEQMKAYHLAPRRKTTFEPVSSSPDFEPSPSAIPVPGDEPIPVSGEEPVPVTDKEPVPVSGEESVSSGEPVPVSGEEPVPVADEEPVPGPGEEPVPGSSSAQKDDTTPA